MDASIVEVPSQRNTRKENQDIKRGEVPEGWHQHKISQKDTEARWIKKNGVSHKNRVSSVKNGSYGKK